MSFDVVVWLGCAVSLPQALPEPETWAHYHYSMPNLEGLPPAIAAQLSDIEGWQLVKETHLIHASYASKHPLTFDDLKSIAPGIQVATIPAGASAAASTAVSADGTKQAALQEHARDANVGVSLVLEGVTDDGVDELLKMASHLARACSGAVLEAPTGFHRLDAQGQEVE